MVTGYEVTMYHNIESIARSMNRIANCMEADEKRARELVDPNRIHKTPQSCTHQGCTDQEIVVVNDNGYCLEHVDDAFTEVKACVQLMNALKEDADATDATER